VLWALHSQAQLASTSFRFYAFLLLAAVAFWWPSSGVGPLLGYLAGVLCGRAYAAAWWALAWHSAAGDVCRAGAGSALGCALACRAAAMRMSLANLWGLACFLASPRRGAHIELAVSLVRGRRASLPAGG
jgi:hypothetical protein